MPQWVAACAADDVEPEDVLGFTHEGADYAVYRSPADEYFATDGRCTHERVRLCAGLVIDNIIECPRHNGRFDYRTGAAKGAPAVIDLRTYATKVEDGQVYVHLD